MWTIFNRTRLYVIANLGCQMWAVQNGVGEGGVPGLSFWVLQMLDKVCSMIFFRFWFSVGNFSSRHFFQRLKYSSERITWRVSLEPSSLPLWKLSTCQRRGYQGCCEHWALAGWPGGGSAVPQAGLEGWEFFPQGGSRSPPGFKKLGTCRCFCHSSKEDKTVINDPNIRAFFS